jgi:cellulose synthase/poly-beta-1,6-N-acetylglucosamine synthase-like glycosyltransferase
VNRKIPNLIVVDKQNGGKADALNMGINVSKNDYVCGIDAD